MADSDIIVTLHLVITFISMFQIGVSFFSSFTSCWVVCNFVILLQNKSGKTCQRPKLLPGVKNGQIKILIIFCIIFITFIIKIFCPGILILQLLIAPIDIESLQNRLLKVCYVPATSASLNRLLFLLRLLTVADIFACLLDLSLVE